MNATAPAPHMIFAAYPRQPRQTGKPWMMVIPVVSTKHITADDGEMLRDFADRDALATLEDGSGHILRISDGADDFLAYSDAFRHLVQSLHERGYQYLRLDADGDEIEGLATFEW